ncbi:SagB/ThcOx family dehydrogenase [Streptomyces sp. WAC06614]|nr:SagB/ThcOx family dehydrogenase [Streptomyces sp. WAC06614]
MLWGSLAQSHLSTARTPEGEDVTRAHRPYPSAGGRYTVRVRLLALGVDGVRPGTYDVVPERRVLRPLGPVPQRSEVKALSGYLSLPPQDPEGIGIDEAPAVLGVYVDLGVLRRRYGLRALRLGLLETGHLAQTLALVATALGLSTSTLAAFHDDLAHELLGLDAGDQPLQYLMPLGRRPEEPVPPA